MASEWPLLTGGRCSEVAVNTGLTVDSNKSVLGLILIHTNVVKTNVFLGPDLSEKAKHIKLLILILKNL